MISGEVSWFQLNRSKLYDSHTGKPRGCTKLYNTDFDVIPHLGVSYFRRSCLHSGPGQSSMDKPDAFFEDYPGRGFAFKTKKTEAIAAFWESLETKMAKVKGPLCIEEDFFDMFEVIQQGSKCFVDCSQISVLRVNGTSNATIRLNSYPLTLLASNLSKLNLKELIFSYRSV